MLPCTPAELSAEIEIKLQRLQSFMREHQFAAISLTLASNFSWITAGLADNQVAHSHDVGAASAVITEDGRKFIVAAHSEIPRLMDQSLARLGYTAVETPWYAAAPELGKALNIDGVIASDIALSGCVLTDITLLRKQLTESEIKKFRWVGQRSTEAVCEVARSLMPGMTEGQIEADIASALWQKSVRPTVLLIGSDERLYKYRHALPDCEKPIEKYAMVNVCAKRWGLIASVTRLVHFGPLSTELRDRLQAAAVVNSRLMAALKPGANVGNIFAQCESWYEELGFSGEWQFHHQGGPCGYGERDSIAAPGSTDTVAEHEAFAFNPTVQGAKVEDTVITFSDHVENITATPDWPMIEVETEGITWQNPDILIVGAPQTKWNKLVTEELQTK
jgi:antitoxin VapB